MYSQAVKRAVALFNKAFNHSVSMVLPSTGSKSDKDATSVNVFCKFRIARVLYSSAQAESNTRSKKYDNFVSA